MFLKQALLKTDCTIGGFDFNCSLQCFKNIIESHLIGLKSRLIIALAVNPLQRPGLIPSARYNVMLVVAC